MSETTLSMEQIEARRLWWQARIDAPGNHLAEELAFWHSEVALCNMAIGNAERVLRVSITAPGEWEIISYPNPNKNIIRRVR